MSPTASNDNYCTTPIGKRLSAAVRGGQRSSRNLLFDCENRDHSLNFDVIDENEFEVKNPSLTLTEAQDLSLELTNSFMK